MDCPDGHKYIEIDRWNRIVLFAYLGQLLLRQLNNEENCPENIKKPLPGISPRMKKE
jgi:hypothetical protein